MADNKKNTGFNLGLVLGAVLGGAAALMLSPKSGKENRQMVGKKLKELREGMEDIDMERVKEIFGDASDSSVKVYKDARKEVLKRVDTMKDNWEDFDMAKYQELVRDVVSHYRDEGSLSTEHLGKLREYLVEDWQKFGKEEQETKKGKKSNGKYKG